jgi:cytochrome c biogenesis protein CcmG/thiol:disulfide interchange protein DsbE
MNYQPRSARPMLVIGAIVLGGWALLVAFIVYGDRNPDTSQPPAIGRKLQQLKLQPLVAADQPIESKELAGKVVLINFWGTWCGYCRMELPALSDLYFRHKDNPDFSFVSVSCSGDVASENEQSLREETESFLKSKDYQFPVYQDQGGVSRRAILELAELKDRGFVFPMTLILDRAGTVQAISPGYAPGGAAEMSNKVEKLLAKGK